MRVAFIGAIVLALAVSFAPGAAAGHLSLVAAAPQLVLADVDLPKVDIDIHKDGGHAWYKNPVVIGLGALVVVLVVALAARGGGGGTTIIERR